MTTRWRIIGIVVIVLLIACATADAGTKKEACQSYLMDTGSTLALDIRYQHAEWYVRPAVWYGLPYTTKESIIKYISYCRYVIYGGPESVVFYDGVSGEKVGKMGADGLKIYK